MPRCVRLTTDSQRRERENEKAADVELKTYSSRFFFLLLVSLTVQRLAPVRQRMGLLPVSEKDWTNTVHGTH